MKDTADRARGMHSSTGTGAPRRPSTARLVALIGGVVVLVCAIIVVVVVTRSTPEAGTTEPILIGDATDDMVGNALGGWLASASNDTGVAVDELAVDKPTPVSTRLDVPYVSQLPELESGCEITAATSALDFYGYNASNTDLNEYLAQGWDNMDPNESFIGYCEGEGWFVYPSPVVDALNSYIADNGGTQVAVDVSGSTPDELYTYVGRGVPVIVWVTIYLQEREVADSWYIDDVEYTAAEEDHCMVLMGYDGDDVILMDPFDGETEYSKEEFEASYASRDDHAVAIFASPEQMTVVMGAANTTQATMVQAA